MTESELKLIAQIATLAEESAALRTELAAAQERIAELKAHQEVWRELDKAQFGDIDRVKQAILLIQQATIILEQEIEGQSRLGSEAQQIFTLTLDLLHKPELNLSGSVVQNEDKQD